MWICTSNCCFPGMLYRDTFFSDDLSKRLYPYHNLGSSGQFEMTNVKIDRCMPWIPYFSRDVSWHWTMNNYFSSLRGRQSPVLIACLGWISCPPKEKSTHRCKKNKRIHHPSGRRGVAVTYVCPSARLSVCTFTTLLSTCPQIWLLID